MAYAKYFYKNGKRFGPYYYESYRDKNGKVKKRYVGTKDPDKKGVIPTRLSRKLNRSYRKNKSFFLFILFLFGFSIFVLLFFRYTGNVIVDFKEIPDNYSIGDKLNGSLVFLIEPGDIIANDSVINISLNLNENVLRANEISINDFLNMLIPVEIVNITQVCENVTINETNQTIENCTNSTIFSYYFNQTGSYSRNIEDLIDYTFSSAGNYTLKFEDSSIGIMSERSIVVNLISNGTDNITEERVFGIQSTPGNIDACQELNVSGVYVMTRNLVDGDVNSTGCFNITVSNVELNCNGFFIRNTSLAAPGIYASDIVNVTIRNCNMTMKSGLSGGYGIRFNYVNNSFIINNTIVSSSWYGIYLTLSSNNQIINNTANSNYYGIYLTSSSNNIITNNTANSNTLWGITLVSSSNNTLTGNTVNNHIGSGAIGIFLSSSLNNILIDNTVNSNLVGISIYSDSSGSNNNQFINNTINSNIDGIWFTSSSNNTLINNNIWNCTGISYGCIYLTTDSNNNIIQGGVINLSSSNLIYLTTNSNNNIFKDLTLLDATKNDTFLTATSINNTFINVSYNLSKEYVVSGSELIRKWYLDVNVTDGTNPLNASNVSAFNVSNALQFSELTNSSGDIAKKEVIEYVNTGSVSGINRTYYSNYTINSSKTGYGAGSISRNITGNTALTLTTSSLYNLSSCGIIDTSGVYVMTRNLVDGDVNSTGCFNITTSNVELDCAGYFIRNTSLAVPGIYAGDNLVNITVKNCNVSMSYSAPGKGIQFNKINDSFIINNTANSNYYGIFLYAGSINRITLINNTVNLNFDGIYISSGSNNTLIGNNVSSNTNYGIPLYSSSGNILINNTINLNFDGIYLFPSSNNSMTGNTISSSSRYGIHMRRNSNNNILINNTINKGGIYINSSSNNTFTNNNILNSGSYSIFINSTSQNNTFIGGLINYSSTSLIFLSQNSSNNLFKDIILLGANKNDTYLELTATNNTFLNVSYNSSKEYVEGGSELIRKWYLDVNVSDGTNAIESANVSAFNVSNALQFSELTNSSGDIAKKEVIEYVNTGSVSGINRTYYSNYTINASKTGYGAGSISRNITGNTALSVTMSSLYNLSSCGIIDSSGVYTMTRNLVDGDVNSTGCFNITASNVELNCNGYFIRNTTLVKPGIYAGNNLVNITVRNCNVTMDGNHGSAYGIQFNYINNSFIINNTANSNRKGIYLTSSSNNTLTGNIANSCQGTTCQGISLSGSNNNQLINNTANSNIFGISLSGSNNNQLINNTANSNLVPGILLSSVSNNNQLINNTANSNHDYGIYLISSSNNTFTNNNIWNCTDTFNFGCVYFVNASNNIIIGGIVNVSLNNLIYLSANSSNNIFKDLTLLGATLKDTYMVTSINNTFINVSYNISKEYVESGSQLIRKWYLDVNVTDGTNAVESANVSSWNVSNALQFSELTNSSGDIAKKEVIEYVNTGSVSGINRTYYSNYTINASKTGYGAGSISRNITGNTALSVTMSSLYNLSSCGVINTAGTYTMTRNLVDGDVNSTGCFNITASNVELNCNGFFIRNISLTKPGIYAGVNIVNITIRNCNVSMKNGDGVGTGYGIQFKNVNNSFIINNTANSNEYGILLTSSSNNIITNNTANSNDIGIYLYSSSNNNTLTGNTANSNAGGYGIFVFNLVKISNNNQIINNTVNFNSRGVLLDSSSNNQVINNTANSNNYGFYLYSSSNNNLTGNTANSNKADGITFWSGSANILINNNIWNCTDATFGCIYLFQTSQNNTFTGGIINLSSSNLIYLKTNSNNNIFKDITLLGATNNDTFLTATSINNTFINVSYNSSKEYVNSSSQLIRKWYLDVNVSDGTNALESANVSGFNVSNALQFSELTNSSGDIAKKEVIEYVNTGSVSGINRTYYSNYTINSSKTGYGASSFSRNITGNTALSVTMSSLYNLSSCGLIDSSGVYTMTRNLVDGDVNSTGCFNITASNVELNCNGYFIRNTNIEAPGIYSGDNLVNITVKNCNVTMGSSDGTGIYFNNVDNSFIINNTANSSFMGIYLYSSSNNILSNNTANSNSWGIATALSSNNNLTGNTANSNDINGIDLYLSSNNNQITNNTANSQTTGISIQAGSNNQVINNIADLNNNGITISSSSNNTLTNNTINSNAYGITISSSSNNTFTNNNIWNCTGTVTVYGCIYLTSTSQNNTFTGGLINLSKGNLIYLSTNSDNNIFQDLTLLGATKNDTFLTSTSINNTFINVSYNSSKEYVASGSSLIRKWYLDVNVSDGTNPLNQAMINSYNNSGSLLTSSLTNSSGLTRQELIEYLNNGGTKSYYSNYSVNVSKSGYYDNSSFINISENKNINFSLNAVPSPPGEGSSGTGGAAAGGSRKNNTNVSKNNVSNETSYIANEANTIETPFGFTGIRKGPVGCVPNWSCGEWGECQITYNLSSITGNSLLLTGERLRVCKDMKDCAYDGLQREECDDKITIIIKKGTGCYEGYIMVYDTNNQLISILNMKKTDKTILDIQIILDNSNYCPSCYNGIMDGDEIDVDCGGSCGQCSEISKRFNLFVFFEDKLIIFIFILILLISTLLVYSFILFMRYLELKKISKYLFIPKIDKPEYRKLPVKKVIEVKSVDEKPVRIKFLNKKAETPILNKSEEKKDLKKEKEIKKLRRLWYGNDA